ncbi:helix-turn-helix domain-containing protein [Nocardia terpenica]|uniref:Helix-turn-helix domain-containing protein n=1 Tax=Nocardia terpenica TaxID=455432 RepID=A0A6G9ZCR2_9NOCA|nr:helix-turn-helix domain-containing protein [Nocardia terpenica]QIS22793.1 helix-turn-helix domain-containing protein [Nocardia terpenica]
MGVVLSTEDVPANERRDYWTHVLDQVSVSCNVLGDSDRDFQAWLHSGDVGPLQMATVAGSAYYVLRTPELIRRNDMGRYLCAVVTEGQVGLEQDDRTALLNRGDVALVDSSRPFRYVGEAARRLVIVNFPHNLLPLGNDHVAQLTGTRMSGRSGTGALISSLLREMAQRLDDPELADNNRLATATVDLIAAGLATRLDRTALLPIETRENVLLSSIHAFIDRHLADPALSPDDIAAAHHINPRYLRKLFQAEGHTVTGWIRAQRLQRCRRDLLDPTLVDRPVAVIAARWGFLDLAHFTRTFRAAFGIPPAAYRRAYQPAAAR